MVKKIGKSHPKARTFFANRYDYLRDLSFRTSQREIQAKSIKGTCSRGERKKIIRLLKLRALMLEGTLIPFPKGGKQRKILEITEDYHVRLEGIDGDVSPVGIMRAMAA